VEGCKTHNSEDAISLRSEKPDGAAKGVFPAKPNLILNRWIGIGSRWSMSHGQRTTLEPLNHYFHSSDYRRPCCFTIKEGRTRNGTRAMKAPNVKIINGVHDENCCDQRFIDYVGYHMRIRLPGLYERVCPAFVATFVVLFRAGIWCSPHRFLVKRKALIDDGASLLCFRVKQDAKIIVCASSKWVSTMACSFKSSSIAKRRG
jgi:hypothetical protein